MLRKYSLLGDEIKLVLYSNKFVVRPLLMGELKRKHLLFLFLCVHKKCDLWENTKTKKYIVVIYRLIYINIRRFLKPFEHRKMNSFRVFEKYNQLFPFSESS